MKTFLALMLAATAFHVAARMAEGHDAPSGWTYDSRCCNTIDCRPIDGPADKIRHHAVQVIEVDGGYQIVKPNGSRDFIAWNAPNIKESKDGEYHWCSGAGLDTTHTICLYVPPRGY